MSDLDEPSLDAIERRLIARAGLAPPAGHRDCVLAVVRDTLAENEKEKVPATKSGQSAQKSYPASPDLVAGTFIEGIDAGGRAAIGGLALTAMLAVVAPWVVLSQAVDLVPAEPRIVTQARAVGIDLPLESLAATSHHSREPLSRSGEPPSARLPDAWRLRNLLTGEL